MAHDLRLERFNDRQAHPWWCQSLPEHILGQCNEELEEQHRLSVERYGEYSLINRIPARKAAAYKEMPSHSDHERAAFETQIGYFEESQP